MSEIIRFEQAVFLSKDSTKEKAKIYEDRYYEVVRFFTKNTILQLLCSDLHYRSFDFIPAIRSGDWSDFLFSELDKYFSEFEEMQNDPRLKELQEKMIEIIVKVNKLENNNR